MSILLDFDLDYFTRPIYKESRDNHRLYRKDPCTIMALEPLFQLLSEKNLLWTPEDVKLFTNHKKSYTLWWTRKYQDCTLVHIDAHSDFYRPKGRDLMKMGNGDITCYNYIWYAVRDGFVKNIFWVLPEDHTLLHMLQEFNSLNAYPEGYSIFDNPPLESASSILKEAIDPIMVDRAVFSQKKIQLSCPVLTRLGERNIEIVICPPSELPIFQETVAMVTAATSPEFISEKADEILPDFCRLLKASDEMCLNLKAQHSEMAD